MPDRYEDDAERLIDALMRVIEFDPDTNNITTTTETKRVIAQALRAVATVPPGHVRVGKEDKRLLGDLVETVDHCVIGDGGCIYAYHGGTMHVARLNTNGRSMFSTREAAAAFARGPQVTPSVSSIHAAR